MGLKELQDTKEFDVALVEAKKNLVVIDFFAKWCGPCKVLAPKLEKLATEMKNVHFYKVDVDVNDQVAADSKITAMPTIICYKEGKEVARVVGANYDKILAMINNN